MAETCAWTYDEGDDTWGAGCDSARLFTLETGGPVEHKAEVARLDAECNQRLAEMTAKRDALFEEATAKGREVARLRAALTELAALVRGECPSLLDEDSGGLGRLSVDIDAALQREGLAPKGEGR